MPTPASIPGSREPSHPNAASRIDAPLCSQAEDTEFRLYESLASVVITRLQQFLQPFQSSPDSIYVFKAMRREEFFTQFSRLANQLAGDCCQSLVQIIQRSSRLAVVREAPASHLAKRLRETAFPALDALLVSYAGVAKKIAVLSGNIKKIRAELEKAAGPGETGATVEPWASEEELTRQEARLLQAQSQAFGTIAHYLNHLDDLPDALLAYACDKCCAGEVNYALEQEEVARIQADIRSALANARETLARVGASTRQELEQEQASQSANVQLEQAHEALEKICEGKIEARQKAQARFRKMVITALVCLLIIGVTILCFLLARR
ncbi:MAG: hypothetical protein HYY23_12240 [Verrucomicrobia bacterium]|nr:hypothetical protein [Verrucomicrobiota bacterium]